MQTQIEALKKGLSFSFSTDEDILRLVLENLSEGVAVADLRSNLVIFNTMARKILGRGMVPGGPREWQEAYGLFLPDGKTPVSEAQMPLARALKGEEVDGFEMFVRNEARPEGCYIEVFARPMRTPDGEVKGGIVVFSDITARRNTFDALMHSEERWRSLVENVPDFILNVDTQFKIGFINHALPPLTPEKVRGTSVFDFVDPEQHFEVEQAFVRALNTGKPQKYESLATNPDGSRSWYSTRLSPIYKEGKVIGFTLITTDDSERRKNREELDQAYARMESHVVERTLELQTANRQLKESRDELRSLYERIVTVQEAERTRIAREIHDVFGQALTSLKYDIAWLVSQGLQNPQAYEKLGKMDEIIDSTIKTVRKISSDLRPGALDDLGLTAAVEWQVKEFQERTGIRCEFINTLGETSVESEEASVTLFRALQEALTNVMRHAKATFVKVVLEESDGCLTLEVSDNGVGITEEQISSRRSLGLMGIRERVAQVGGMVQMAPGKPSGTLVRVQIPQH